MREGQFHIVGTIVGVIVVSAGFNGLALIGVPSYAQFLFQGILLIVAVAFSSIGRRLSRE
jgi:ribose transport system permease protein